MRRVLHTRDRGAVIPIVALLLPVLMIMTAFAVDLGSQRSLRRELQADADVIALDLVRLADGRSLQQIEQDPGYLGYVNQSLTNNGVAAVSTVGDLQAIVAFGDFESGRDPEFQASSAPTDVPNAVEVELQGSVDYRFAPGTGGSTRRAVATKEGLATFSVGSRLASFDTADAALLDPIMAALFNPQSVVPTSTDAVPFSFTASPYALPTQTETDTSSGNVGLSALSYEGLANSNIVLNDLLGYAFADVAAANADVASPADVLTSEMSVVTLLEASASALAASGEGVHADVVIDYLLDLATHADQDITLKLSDLLGLDVSQPGSVLDLEVNLLDLLLSSAQFVNGQNTVDVGFELPDGVLGELPGFQEIPGFTGIADPHASLALSVVEVPQLGAGRPNDPNAVAETSQIAADLEVGLRMQLDLSGLDWGLLKESEAAEIALALPLQIDIAQARTRLTELICKTADPSTLDLPTLTRAAQVRIGTSSPSGAPVDLSSPQPDTTAGELAVISIAGGVVARVSGAAEGQVGTDKDTAIDDLAVGQTFPITPSALGLRDLLETELDVDVLPGTLLGFLLGRILNPIDTVVNRIVSQVLEPLLNAVDRWVVSRLLDSMGVGVAGADVRSIDAICNSPKLVG